MNEKSNQTLIQLKEVTKSFLVGGGSFDALKNVNLDIAKGEMVAVVGKSGSGKSTLLNIMAGIDKATAGTVSINGVTIDRLSESDLASWRGKNIGVVFQFFQLIPTLTVVENIMLPMDFCHTYHRGERRKRALSLLDVVDIKDQADKFPAALSGGQQQRAAIARALANDPAIIVADEPTGNLDSNTAASIFNLLASLAGSGKTVVVVTHEQAFLSHFSRCITMADGMVEQRIAVNH